MSSVIRTAVIGPEPVSVSDMKNFLKVPVNVTTDDALIKSLIKSARIQAEIISDAVIVRSSFVQYMDGFPHRGHSYWSGGLGRGPVSAYDEHYTRYGEIKIKRTPLISITSTITYIGTDGNSHTLTPGTDFIVDSAKQPGRIRPVIGTAWPLTLRTPNAIAIPFTAGYAPNAAEVSQGATPVSEPETIVEGTIPSPPDQQASYTVDWTLPETVPVAIMQLVSHWYFNREPVVAGSANPIPLHVLDLLATISVPDYAPTPD